MIDHRKIIALLVACPAIVIPLATPGAADQSVACPEFPRVAWWGELSHQAVVGRVAKDHDGDWQLYLKKWSDQLETLRNADTNRQEVFIAGRGLRLRGAALKAYLDKVVRRLEVTRCLAQQQSED